MSHRPLSIIVLLFALAFAGAPLLSDGFNGFSPEQFPVKTPWPAQPAGWAFSIWGLIYLALIVAALIGLLRGGGDWPHAALPLAVSLVIGVPWITAANRAPLIATGMIVVMTGFAILAWRRRGPHLWQALSLGLYAGWLTAASGVAISAVLTGYGILSAQIAALLMLLVVLGIGLFVLTRPGNGWSYAPALVWALAGVIAANTAPVDLPIVITCGMGIVLLVAVAAGRRKA